MNVFGKIPQSMSISLMLGAATAFGIGGCGTPGMSHHAGIDDGSDAVIEGELRVMISDHEDLSTQKRYFLITAAETEVELLFSGIPAVSGGMRLHVEGSSIDDHTFHVDSFDVVENPPGLIGTTENELVAAGPEPTRQVAFVVLNFGTPDSMTPDLANQRVFTGPTSTKAYYKEDSYGIRNIDGKVLGPFTVPAIGGDCNLGTGGGLTNLTNAANAAIKASGDDPKNYQHVLYYFPKSQACGWAGLGYQPGNQAWYNGASSGQVIAHEIGHNFFLFHASSYACKDAAGAPVPFSSNCTPNEYGDRFDPMGSGYFHSTVYQKAQQGWFGKCNLVTVGANGTFDLLPIEQASNGLQAIRVVRDANSPKTSSYYVEYRQTLGAFDNSSSNGVFLHVAPAPTTKEHPFLLDMTPSTSSVADAALKVGQTFADPDGKVNITLVSSSATSAQVKFDFPGGASGAATCLDGTTFTPSSGGTTQPPPPPPPPPPGNGSGTFTGNFKIVLPATGKCLDVNGAGTADGTNIQEWTCNGTAAQSFQIQDAGGGNVRIVNTNSNKCLDVVGAGSADGTNVQLLACNGGAGQTFRMQDAGGGIFTIVNPSSSKCVDVSGARSADGTNVQLWTCNNGGAQRWQPVNL